MFVLFYEPAESASALPFPAAIITAATREGQNSLMVWTSSYLSCVGKELHQAEGSTLILFGAASSAFSKTTSQESYIVDSYFSFVRMPSYYLFSFTQLDLILQQLMKFQATSNLCHTWYISAVGMNTVSSHSCF